MRPLGKMLVCSFMICLLPLLGVAAAELEIPSVKVENAPEIDGAGMDAVWAKVKPISVADAASRAKILLRSVYTDDQIFFLVQYPDTAENFLHKPWVWNAAEKKYESGSHREDTFVFKWNMMDHDVNLSNFSDDDYRADVWYWKANRTNPAGYADDKNQKLSDSQSEKSTEIESLTGKKRFLSRHSDKGKPAYTEFKPTTYTEALVDRYPKSMPEGSRADVIAKGQWKNGNWTIEFERKLDTGHSDDVQFDLSKKYLFGVSIFSLYGKPHDPNSPNLYGRGRISDPLMLSFE